MNQALFALTLTGITLAAATPGPDPRSAARMGGVGGVGGVGGMGGMGGMGGFKTRPVDLPLVQEAKAAVQKQLAVLQLETVREAATQVVAGTNVWLDCRVKEPDGYAEWTFIILRRLDGSWSWSSARRLRPLPAAEPQPAGKN